MQFFLQMLPRFGLPRVNNNSNNNHVCGHDDYDNTSADVQKRLHEEYKVMVQKVQEKVQKVFGLRRMSAAAVPARAHAISHASTNACDNNNLHAYDHSHADIRLLERRNLRYLRGARVLQCGVEFSGCWKSLVWDSIARLIRRIMVAS